MIKYIEMEQDDAGHWFEVGTYSVGEDILAGVLIAGAGIIGALAVAVIAPAIMPGIEHNTNRQGDPLGGLLRLANNLSDGLGLTGTCRQPKPSPVEMERFNRITEHHERTRKRYFDVNTGEWKSL